MMKKTLLLLFAALFLFSGCGEAKKVSAADPAAGKSDVEANAAQEDSQSAQEKEPATLIKPLPDRTMENLTDAILSVSLEEGDAYVDDTGKMQMDVKIYAYDKYDMVDISMMKVGDTIVTHTGEVEVTSLQRSESGTLYINGGLEEGGFDLVTGENNIYFETGFNDAKNWYEVGEATIRVSTDFKGYDFSDPEQGEVTFYPGSFLTNEITDYNFTPYNTTIRVAEGQIVEMNRTYTP